MTEDYDPHELDPNRVIAFVSSSDRDLRDLRSFFGRLDTFINKLIKNRHCSTVEPCILNSYFMYSAEVQRHDFDKKEVLGRAYAALCQAILVVNRVKERASVRMHKVNVLLEECASISGPLKEEFSNVKSKMEDRKRGKGPARIIDLMTASAQKRR
jgi:hypothetical protein